jgi:hypothetical protein
LIQDYPGKKELVILNDNPEQTLVFDHPEVVIENRKERFPTTTEKHLFNVGMCQYDYMAPWASDDICFANRLSTSVERIHKGGPMFHLPDDRGNFQFYGPGWWIICHFRKTDEPGEIQISWRYQNSFDYGATLWSREAYEEVVGNIEPHSGHSLGWLLGELFHHWGYWSFDRDLPQDEKFYVYRRFYDHDKFAHMGASQKRGLEEYELEKGFWRGHTYSLGMDFLANRARRGTIELKPHWKVNYALLLDADRRAVRMGDLW